MGFVTKLDEKLIEHMENLWSFLPINPYSVAKFGIWTTTLWMLVYDYKQYGMGFMAVMDIIIIVYSFFAAVDGERIANWNAKNNRMNPLKSEWHMYRYLNIFLSALCISEAFILDSIQLLWVVYSLFVVLMSINWVQPEQKQVWKPA